MEECSLDLIFLNLRLTTWFSGLGQALTFSNSYNLIFLDKVKAFILFNHIKYFLQLLLAHICWFNFSFHQVSIYLISILQFFLIKIS